MTMLLFYAGIFTMTLGVLHVFMPILLDFDTALPATGDTLRPFRLLFLTYDTQRSDLRGIIWGMNHAVSFALVTIGVVDLMASKWLDHRWALWIAIWIAAWWLLRAGCQFYLGRRRGDGLVAAWFTALGVLHICAVP